MIRENGKLRVVKRIAIALIVLGIVLSAVSCGQKGNIYGDVVWDYTMNYIVYPGLFNTYNLSYGTAYQISEGTYNYKYQVYYYSSYYGAYIYYPGVNLAYYGTYTTTAEAGSFPFVNGKDNNFELYCSAGGMAKSGSGVSSIVPPANGSAPTVTPQLGTQTWTENGLRITVTTQIVNLSDQDRASLKQAVHK